MRNFKDRISTIADRKKITFEDNQEERFAIVEFADEATELGTDINRTNMMGVQGYIDSNITFNPDGSIVTIYPNNVIETTSFRDDGSIKQEYNLNGEIKNKFIYFEYDGRITETFTERPYVPKKPLNETSWGDIEFISDNGLASKYWKIGDTKTINVNEEILTLEILDFNHDDLLNGNKAGITFGLKYLMNNTKQINATKTNVGGFTGSDIYSWLQGELLLSLPTDLQAVIKTVNKKTSAGNQSSVINTNEMKIFLFSEIEIYGTTSFSFTGEGNQYRNFYNPNNRIKTFTNGSSIIGWWERSPGTNAGFFCAADNSTQLASHDYSDAFWGISFGFCV